MRSSKNWLGVLVAAGVSAFASNGHAYQWFVDTTTDGVGVAGCSLREAVAAAELNATQQGCTRTGSAGNNHVGVRAGTYPLNSRLQIKSNLRIEGEVVGGVLATHIVGGAGSMKGFRVSAGTGGANVSVTFRHLRIRNFITNDGAAVIVDDQQYVTVERSILRENQASLGLGGAIMVGANAGLFVNGSWLYDNFASRGGAIRGFSGSSIEIYSSALTRNESNQEAGAIWSDGTMTIHQTTFAENVAGRHGGALYLTPSSNTFIYASTFKDNTAVFDGQTVYVSGAGAYVGIGHSAVAQSTDQPDCESASAFSVSSFGYNVVKAVSGTCSVAVAAGDMLNVAPTLNSYGSAVGPSPVSMLGYLSKPPGQCGNLIDRAPSFAGPLDGFGVTRLVNYAACAGAGAGKTQDIGASEYQAAWPF